MANRTQAKSVTWTLTDGNIFMTLVRFREVGIIVFIIALIIVVTIRSPNFLTVSNFRDILLSISILTIVALAQTIVIITRGIDLSVSSMIGLTAMMVAFMVVQYPAMSPVVAVLLGMALGLVLGALNGLRIAVGGVPPIIATLGTLSIYRGAVFFYSGGTWVNAFEMTQSFKVLAKGTPLLGVPNLIVIAVVVVGIVYVFLGHTRIGRDIYAIGSNPEAALMAGVRVQRLQFLVYTISGVFCGMAGVLWASRVESAQTNTALGFELPTVAAAVVGGVNIFGGSGTVLGVVLGALLLGLIDNALKLMRITPFWRLAAQGLLILLAVVVDSVILRRLQRTSSPGQGG